MAASFTCENCGAVFECDESWTDEDAKTEAAARGWSAIPLTEMAVVCHDCYRELTA